MLFGSHWHLVVLCLQQSHIWRRLFWLQDDADKLTLVTCALRNSISWHAREDDGILSWKLKQASMFSSVFLHPPAVALSEGCKLPGPVISLSISPGILVLKIRSKVCWGTTFETVPCETSVMYYVLDTEAPANYQSSIRSAILLIVTKTHCTTEEHGLIS